MPIIAVLGLDSTPAPGSRPSSVAGRDHSPEVGVKMKTQIREIVGEGRMNGRKNARRKNHWPRAMRLVSTASTKESTTSGGTVYSVNWSVCHSEDQKSSRANIS